MPSQEGLIMSSDMFSELLYNLDAQQRLVAHYKRHHFEHSEFLDRVITIKMAMRAVGIGVD